MSVVPDVERTVTQALESYLTAWNNKDHDALAGFYSSAGDLLAADGQYLGNPGEIRDYYRSQLDGPYGEIKLKNLKVETIRSIHNNVLIADTGWEAFMSTAGQSTNPVARPRGTFVLSPTDESWQFSAVRIMVPFRAA